VGPAVSRGRAALAVGPAALGSACSAPGPTPPGGAAHRVALGRASMARPRPTRPLDGLTIYTLEDQ
jgi:hypothetical protein